MKQPSTYIPFIPEFRFDPSLTKAELRVYDYVLYRWRAFSYHGGEFKESVSTIANALQCAERTVRTALQHLHKKKILDVQHRTENGKKITSVITPLDKHGRKMKGRDKSSHKHYDWDEDNPPF